MNPDLFWIPGPWSGRLAIITRPRGGDWLVDEVKGWRRTGIDMVVSLLETDEAAQLDLAREAEAAEASNVRFVSFPIPDRGAPASTTAALSLIRVIADSLRNSKNVAVHCRQGIGRSGMIAAGVLVNSVITPEQAIETVSLARGQMIPETRGQRQWLKELPSEQPLVA
ncbi:MAG TPA: dual specificity protein phosphatase family protein [Bryobacteraceae bacterium]